MSGNNNIRYTESQLAAFYSQNRVTWQAFYPSEQRVFERLGICSSTRLIDLGCACGGLGMALRERFGLRHYLGVDLSREAVSLGSERFPELDLRVGDFLDLPESLDENWDVVCSLSCIDWNIEFDAMLTRLWRLVAPGGHAVVSVRLTPGQSVLNVHKSYQYVNFEGAKSGERAPYVVLNYQEWLERVLKLEDVMSLYAYGYWGKPSPSAITPFGDLVFGVFQVTKRDQLGDGKVEMLLDLSSEVV